MPEEINSDDTQLDKLVNDLQSAVDERTREVYSAKVVELFENPVNVGRLENPDGFASVTGPCGDSMQVYVRVRDGRVSECTFMTDGCGGSIVAGSMATLLAIDQSVEDAQKIGGEQILNGLGGLPEQEAHCPALAAEALRKALEDYQKK
jgi:nitrogen fixation NifU-like protein